MSHYVPPVIVDVIPMGDPDLEFREVAGGIYEMLRRRVGLKRPRENRRPQLDGRSSESEQYWSALSRTREVEIPVFIGRNSVRIQESLADLELHRNALRVIVVIVSEGELRIGGDRRVLFLKQVERLKEQGALVLLAPLHKDWLELIDPGDVPLRNHLFPQTVDDEVVRPSQDALEEGIGFEICSRLGHNRLRVFISHAKADLEPTQGLATKILYHLNNHTRLGTFFDAKNLSRGKQLDPQLKTAIADSLLLCVVGDSFSDSPYCQQEVLTAKRLGGPILSVSGLTSGESRSLSFGGNHHRLAWPTVVQPLRDIAQADSTLKTMVEQRELDALNTVARECLRTQLQHWHFLWVADEVERHAQRGEPLRRVSRPPEPVDVSTGLIPRDRSATVLYPDPPLPRAEAEVFQGMSPRCTIVTPTTLHVASLFTDDDRHQGGTAGAPLAGLRIAVSVSADPGDTPALKDGTSETGLVDWRIDEVIADAALSVIRLGAGVGYGGHHSPEGFMNLLIQLLSRHNRMAGGKELLYAYAVPSIIRGDSPQVTRLHRVDVEVTPFPGEDEALHVPWECSQMRRFMAYHERPKVPEDPTVQTAMDLWELEAAKVCDARVCIGGTSSPKSDTRPGYSGPFPGLVEEAWWTVASPKLRETPKPLYVLGGFGGASKILADCLDPDCELPKEMTAQHWSNNQRFGRISRAYQQHARAEVWEVPESIDQMARDLRDYGERLKVAGTSFNGLTWEENKRLLRTTSSLEAASLLGKGLLAWRRLQRPPSGLRVLVQRGDALRVRADALGLASIADLGRDQIVGLDKAVLEAAGWFEQSSGDIPTRGAARLLGLPPSFATRFVSWASLGDSSVLDSAADLTKGATAAAREIVDLALKRGCRSLVMVPIGGALIPSEDATRALLQGTLEALDRDDGKRLEELTLCELDPGRYRQMLRTVRRIAADGQLAFTELQAQAGLVDVPLSLRITQGNDAENLLFEVDIPSHAAIADGTKTIAWTEVDQLLEEVQALGREPKEARRQKLWALGRRLHDEVLPECVQTALRTGGRPVEVRHDARGSYLPVELLTIATAADDYDSLDDPFAWVGLRGLSRRPLRLPTSKHRARRRNQGPKVRALLVIDPTGDLPGTREEQRRLETILKAMPLVECLTLVGSDATKASVLDALATGFGVLHYAGHATLTEDPQRSGLLLSGREILCADDLVSLPDGYTPPFVFLNACRSARRLWKPDEDGTERVATNVAEQFLCAGVQNLVGSLWDVNDHDAATLAVVMYRNLTEGCAIGASLVRGRRRLFEQSSIDAFNYVLFGEPSYRFPPAPRVFN